jgi:hypothetical protein
MPYELNDDEREALSDFKSDFGAKFALVMLVIYLIGFLWITIV